jgi:5-enolpyruvylshikimate-3-phosphate synthase
LAGTLGDGAEIGDADCVAISYPSFWDDLQALGAAL